MTLTPFTLRTDLKCGRGSISEGEKCTKGAATKRAPRAGATERLLKKAGTIGAVGSLGYTAAALFSGSGRHTIGGLSAFNASAAAFNAGEALGYERKGQKAKATKAKISAGVAAGYAALGAGLLAQDMIARRKYVQNVHRAGQYAYGTGQRPPGANGAGYRGAQGGARRPRGYQGDPFQELGVSASASAADLKKAWKAKMMQHHPDRGGDPETAKKINEAYQAIMRSKGIKDSIYADGFDIDWEAIAL